MKESLPVPVLPVGDSALGGALYRQILVSEWIDAFNRRDLHGMLMRLDQDVDFHPSDISGTRRSYRGHEGVRLWFRELMCAPQAFCVHLNEVRDVRPDTTLATGSLGVPEEPDLGPFWAVHHVRRGVIVSVHHYFTGHDLVDLLESVRHRADHASQHAAV